MSPNSLLRKISHESKYDQNNVFVSDVVFYGKKFWDNNIFFTGLITYTLSSIKGSFPEKEQLEIDCIIEKSQKAFDFFSNRHGGITYNFYQTKPLQPYACIPLLNKWKALWLPDDVDDTVIIYLAQTVDAKTNLQVKQKIEALSFDGKKIKSFPKKYRYTKAYRTWFVTKMNHDMDICVMANALLFTFEKQLPLSIVDQESIALICEIVRAKKHFTQAYLLSPHYKKTSIVLYHLVRLVAVSQDNDLLSLKDQLITDIHKSLSKVKNNLEKVILITSLYKLKAPIEFTIELSQKDFKNFFWFKANPFSNTHIGLKKLLSKRNFLHLKYRCIPHSLILVFELQKIANAEVILENEVIYISK